MPFVDTFNEIDSTRQIASVRQLPEAGHDFRAELSGASIEIQLTELVDRAYTFPMTEDEYKAGKWSSVVLRGSGQIPRRLDEELRDRALTDIIAKKVEKSYACTPSVPTWLVVFSTTPYSTEYIKSGELRVSEALDQARAYLSACADLVFQEVWFTDLQSRPVQVWPLPSD